MWTWSNLKVCHSSPQSGCRWCGIQHSDKVLTFNLNLGLPNKRYFYVSLRYHRYLISLSRQQHTHTHKPLLMILCLIHSESVWLALYRVHRGENWSRPAVLQSLLIAVNLRLRWLSSVLRREKKNMAFVARCSAFIYILSHTQGVELSWSLLQGPAAA